MGASAMTHDHLSFTECGLTPQQIERVEALTTELMQRIAPEDTPSVEFIYALAQAFASVAARAAANRALARGAGHHLLAEIRRHVTNHMPSGARETRVYKSDYNGLTINELNFMRALIRHPNSVEMADVRRESNLDPRSLNKGSMSALRAGFVECERLSRRGWWKLTPRGRQILAELATTAPRTGAKALIANPIVTEKRVSGRAPMSQRARMK
jgi:DNA-binding MarR family transcriptional regulator